MVKKSIYPERSQEVKQFFSKGVAPEKLLVIPIDFAKTEYTARICLGTGDYLLKKPMKIYNDKKGADYHGRRIQGICRKYHIVKSNAIIGGEDPPNYTVNFVHYVRDYHNYSFVRINAYEAKKYRTNTRASSDNLDLNGIAQGLLNRRAHDIAEFDEIFANLKNSSRSRRKFVKEETAAKNRIHRCVEILFPDFLNKNESGLLPFTNASLELMEENFSVLKIKRMRTNTLVKVLRRNHTAKPEEVAGKLKILSEKVLAPPPDLISYQNKSLSTKVAFLRSIRDSIVMEENEMARFLVQTPSFFLTSFPGPGVVLGGGLAAEYGDPSRWLPADHMASYGGIVPRQKQSGGSDKFPITGHLPKDCNHILKDWLLQGAYHVGTTRHPMGKLPGRDGMHRLIEHYQRIENNEGKSRLSTAKLLIRIGRRMVLNERVYMPSEWVKRPAPSDGELFEFLDCVNQSLNEKWKKYDLSGIDNKRNYWVKWKEYCDDLKKNSCLQFGVSAPK